jgi:hypothetical protein
MNFVVAKTIINEKNEHIKLAMSSECFTPLVIFSTYCAGMNKLEAVTWEFSVYRFYTCHRYS